MNAPGEPGDGPEARGGPRPARLGAVLRRAWIGYRLTLEADLAAAGFEGALPDARVLRICSRDPAVTIAEIGRELGISRQGAAKIVAGLSDRGYLTLGPSPRSGREKLLSLTPRAREYLQVHRRTALRIDERIRAELGEEDLSVLYRLLDVLGGPEQPGLLQFLESRSHRLPEPID